MPIGKIYEGQGGRLVLEMEYEVDGVLCTVAVDADDLRLTPEGLTIEGDKRVYDLVKLRPRSHKSVHVSDELDAKIRLLFQRMYGNKQP